MGVWLISPLENAEETFDAFKAACTEWLHTTDTGKQAMEMSCGAFNIGDFVLLQASDMAELKAALTVRNLQLRILEHHYDYVRDYDEVLYTQQDD